MTFLRTSRPRFCARLDLKGKYLVKGIGYEGLGRIGNPDQFLDTYYNSCIDEIHLWNTVSSLFKTDYIGDIIESISSRIFVPIVAGGGINNIEQIGSLLARGCDKVILNRAAVLNPNFLRESVATFGSSTISVAVDVVQDKNLDYYVTIDSGRINTGIPVQEWLHTLNDLNAGEVILTSLENEGRLQGYDLQLLDLVKDIPKCPLVIHGGAGSLEHLLSAVINTNVAGVSSASLLHFTLLRDNSSIASELLHCPASLPIINRLSLIKESPYDLKSLICEFKARLSC